MPNAAKVYELTKKGPGFGAARVLAVDEAAGLVKVRLLNTTDRPEVWCRPVLSLARSLVCGDEVLVAGEGGRDTYVVDLLARSPAAEVKRPSAATAIETGTGAFVVVDPEGAATGNEVIKIFSSRKELVFEYDAKAEKARILVPSGDLDLAADSGNMTLTAAGKIQFKAEKVDVAGRAGVRLGVPGSVGDAGVSVALGPQKVKIDSPEMNVSASRGALFFTELHYAGKKIVATAGHVQMMVRKLETVAKTILEKADNVYRKVAQLSQLQAGRKRDLVDDTYYVKSHRSVMKAEKNFKVKSDKIHLG